MKQTNTAAEKPKRRFNAADAVILILILLVGALLYWAFFGTGTVAGLFGKGEKTVALEYKVRVEGVLTEFSSRVKAGDLLYQETGKRSIGRVEEGIVVEPYKEEVYISGEYDENGNLISDPAKTGAFLLSEKPGYVTVTIPLSARATEKSDGYYVDGCRISFGEELELQFRDFWGRGTVVEVVASEENGGND